jgi:hypothetical protein
MIIAWTSISSLSKRIQASRVLVFRLLLLVSVLPVRESWEICGVVRGGVSAALHSLRQVNLCVNVQSVWRGAFVELAIITLLYIC